MKLGIFGAGYSGREIGRRIAETGAQVWGTNREGDNNSLAKQDITAVVFDGKTLSDQALAHLKDTSHLVISIAPPRTEGGGGLADPTLAALAQYSLADIAPKLEWVGYLSTVGVYGNHDGDWVDETTPATPASERSRQRVRAENEWLSLGAEHNCAVGIFRLAGIYGPGRNALINATNNTSRRMIKKHQVFNRIHVGDIGEALKRAAIQKAAGVFNISDDQPAPPQDVVVLAHTLVGTPPPAEIDFETADITPMARSFYGENKRVSNAKSKEILGLEYAWPNYRIALTRMWENQTWLS